MAMGRKSQWRKVLSIKLYVIVYDRWLAFSQSIDDNIHFISDSLLQALIWLNRPNLI
jgi:hypothetical protein